MNSPPVSSPHHSFPVLSNRWLVLLLMMLWLAVWQAGRLVEYTEHASLWFPAAGLTFAALMVMGRLAIVPILICAVVVTYWVDSLYSLGLGNGTKLLTGLLFGVVHLASYGLGAGLIRIWADQVGHRLPGVIIASLVMAALSSLLATWLELWVLIAGGMMAGQLVSEAWLPYWIGDMAGIMAMGPLFVWLLTVLSDAPRNRITALLGSSSITLSTKVIYKILLNMLLILVVMVLARFSSHPQVSYAMFFLVLPHMWLACTETPAINALAVAISSVFIVSMVHILGLLDVALVYQFAICVIAANALFSMAIPLLAAENKALRRMVSTDSLTQVASRERLIEHAEMEIRHSLHRQLPLTLIVFDIDHFKRINDVHGHHIGDIALQAASQICQSCLRPADLLGRFGGDEFVLVLPATDQQQGAEICQRMLTKLNGYYIAGQQPLHVSFGLVQIQPDDNFHRLFERADQALYQAKQKGRNQIQLGS